MRICTKCLEYKDSKQFYKSSPKKNDGFDYNCKICRSSQRKKSHDKEKTRNRHLKKMYGIGLDEYNSMFEMQKGNCLICSRHQSDLTYSLHVDHDHKTGRVRGLLCFNCNQLLGNARDCIEVLAQSINYLKRFG